MSLFTIEESLALCLLVGIVAWYIDPIIEFIIGSIDEL